MKRGRIISLVILLIGVVAISIWMWPSSNSGETPIEYFATYQTADPPLFLPADGQPRHRLDTLSAWDLASLPRAVRFDAPMGTAHGALTYDAQPFWSMNEARGGHHTGDDLNGIGGMNSDLGDPIYAVADGRVLFAGEAGSGWGKIIILGHRTADGRVLQSMYAHLQKIRVAVDMVVGRGQVIGRCGTADGHYPAHLHFEMRDGRGVDIGHGYASEPLTHLNPSATITALRGAAPEDLSPALLPGILRAASSWDGFNFSPKDAEKLGELLKSQK